MNQLMTVYQGVDNDDNPTLVWTTDWDRAWADARQCPNGMILAGWTNQPVGDDGSTVTVTGPTDVMMIAVYAIADMVDR